jgi:hypothetical protein
MCLGQKPQSILIFLMKVTVVQTSAVIAFLCKKLKEQQDLRDPHPHPGRSNRKLKFTKFSAPTPGDKPPPRCRNSPRINPSRFFALHQINSPPLCLQRHDNSSVRFATPIGGVTTGRSNREDSSNGVFENKIFVSDYTLPVPLWQARASDSFKKRRPTVPSMVRTRPDILSV